MAGDFLRIDENSFDNILNNEKKILIVYFCTETCPDCKAVNPMFNQLSEEFRGKAVFTKIDPATNVNLGIRYNIMYVPTFKFFKGGKLIGDLTGNINAKRLNKTINKLIQKQQKNA
jgi:thiol-disulfide isomerase/thioredoxin